jgi:predicted branched-subunit amino acid permease
MNLLRMALDYALAAMFIALLVLQIGDNLQILVALLSGVLSACFLLIGMEQWNVIVAAVAGATIGVVFERWIKGRFFYDSRNGRRDLPAPVAAARLLFPQ